MSDALEITNSKESKDEEKSLPISIVNKSSDRQKKHLEYAREVKAKKAQIKQEQSAIFQNQLKDIYVNLSGIHNRMTSMNENINTLIGSYSGNKKRSRDESKKTDTKNKVAPENSDTEEFEPKPKETKTPTEGEVDAAVKEDTPMRDFFVKSIGQVLGVTTAMATLYLFRSWKSNQNKHPSQYLYKDIL